MANVNHSSLTDPYLHEPKGVAAASSGNVYVANGSGSGTWKPAERYISAYVAFSTSSPESQAITTTFSALDPTIIASQNNGFTPTDTPNARISYTGAEDIVATFNFTTSVRHAAGAKRDVELVLRVNGVDVPGSHCVMTADSSDWSNGTLVAQLVLEQNDYIEIFAKASQSITLETAGAYLTVEGVIKP